MTASVRKTSAKFEDAIASIGYGRFNVYVLLIGGGCLMSVAMETMGMMFVMPSAECDLELDLTSKGILASSSFLGVVSSSHLWGFVADTRGRRIVLIISMVVGVVTSVSSSLVPEAWMFILLRYVNGFFIGGASAVVYVYVGEFHDRIYRPKVVTWIATFFGLGNVTLPALAWLVLPLDIDFEIPYLDTTFKPWRLLVVSIGLPSLFIAIGLYNLPESPKYLLSQGRHREALEALQRIFATNTGKNPEEFPVSELIWDEIETKSDGRTTGLCSTLWFQTAPLFKTPYLRKTIMMCLLQFGTFASSSGFFMWYPEVLNRMASYEEDGSMCDAIEFYNNNQTKIGTIQTTDCDSSIDKQVYQTSLYIGASLSVLYILTGSLINVVGAKKLLIAILGATSVCGLAAQLVHEEETAKALMGAFLMVSTGVGVITTLAVDLYPTQFRGMALAISLMAGRCGAVTGSHLVGIVIYKLCGYTFFIFAVQHLLLVIITVLIPVSPRAQSVIEPIT